MKKYVIKLMATFFYAGLSPVAPGTVGSFFGLLIFISSYDKPWLCAVLFVCIIGLGFFVSGPAEKVFGKKDPHEVVIDEVSGIFLVFFMIPIGIMSLVLGFILYRFFDVVKPFFIRRLERLPGGFGIMTDDLLCGVYANLVLRGLFALNILH